MEYYPCPRCNRDRVIRIKVCYQEEIIEETATCPECNGRGEIEIVGGCR